VAPPLLLLGQPVLPLFRGLPRWIFKDALGPFLGSPELKQVGRALVYPVVSWFALAAAIMVWHLPRLYELALHSESWHRAEHACFFWAALAFWWPVVGVWPSHPVWPRWAMIPYLLLADLVNTGLSAVLSSQTTYCIRVINWPRGCGASQLSPIKRRREPLCGFRDPSRFCCPP
jgi:putative membrane protein